MKDFRTWMSLRESDSHVFKTAYGNEYEIKLDQKSESASAMIKNNERGEDVEMEHQIDELALGDGDYAKGIAHVYGISDGGTFISGITVYKDEINITDNDHKKRDTTDADLVQILHKMLSDKKYLDRLQFEFDRD
jgi:hypothetical protein